MTIDSSKQELLDRVNKLEAAIKEIDITIRIPAAEYVPAISDVFSIIDNLGVPK